MSIVCSFHRQCGSYRDGRKRKDQGTLSEGGCNHFSRSKTFCSLVYCTTLRVDLLTIICLLVPTTEEISISQPLKLCNIQASKTFWNERNDCYKATQDLRNLPSEENKPTAYYTLHKKTTG